MEQQSDGQHMPINHHRLSQPIFGEQQQQQHEQQQHYRLMEQQQRAEAEQQYVLDLSVKNKKNDSSSSSIDDAETRSITSDDDVKMRSDQLPHPLQSLLSLSGQLNKPMYTSNDMTMFWNMLMHFSFNNYQNYFSQFKDGGGGGSVDVLKGRY
jgi:hypothetical protein